MTLFRFFSSTHRVALRSWAWAGTDRLGVSKQWLVFFRRDDAELLGGPKRMIE